MKMRQLSVRFVAIQKPPKFWSVDENVVATSEVYCPVSGRLNTPSGRHYHTLPRLIISNSNIPHFKRVTSQWKGGFSESTKMPHSISAILELIRPVRIFFSKSPHSLTGQLLFGFKLIGSQVSLFWRMF